VLYINCRRNHYFSNIERTKRLLSSWWLIMSQFTYKYPCTSVMLVSLTVHVDAGFYRTWPWRYFMKSTSKVIPSDYVMIVRVLCNSKTCDGAVPCDIRALNCCCLRMVYYHCCCLRMVCCLLVTGSQRLNGKEYISVKGKWWFSLTPLFVRGKQETCNCVALGFRYRWGRAYTEVLTLIILPLCALFNLWS
jgi:hypothetical protein